MDEPEVSEVTLAPELEVKEEPTIEVEDKKAKPDEDVNEIEQARNLYRLLKNPTSAKAIIRTLAEEHGLTFDKKDSPKAEDKKVRTIKSLVKDQLGEEYGFLAEKLGNIFEEALASERENIETKFRDISLKSAEREATEAFDYLQNKYDDAKNYENDIVALMEKIPNGEMSAKEYLETLYDVVKAKENRTKGTKKLAEKINRNSSDPEVKLSGKTRSGDVQVKSTKGMSIDDALADAVASIKI